jgi:hypothetical protein
MTSRASRFDPCGSFVDLVNKSEHKQHKTPHSNGGKFLVTGLARRGKYGGKMFGTIPNQGQEFAAPSWGKQIRQAAAGIGPLFVQRQRVFQRCSVPVRRLLI